jgi:hypothetical protein
MAMHPSSRLDRIDAVLQLEAGKSHKSVSNLSRRARGVAWRTRAPRFAGTATSPA